MRGLRLFAVALAAGMAASLATSVAADSTIPVVTYGSKLGPVAVPASSTLGVMAEVTLPAGRWVAWAKLWVIDGNSSGYSNVTCGLGPTATRLHRGYVQVGNPSYTSVPLKKAFALSATATFTDAAGKIGVRCGANRPGVTARWIKIVAMKLGTLKSVNMATAAAVTSGSGSPTAVIGSRSGAINVPTGQTTTLGSLSLGAGAWAIRTSFSLDIDNSEDTTDWGQCALLVNGVKRDSVAIFPDQADAMAVMDWAVSSTSAITATVTCKGEALGPGGYGPVSAREVRITALKLGTLLTYTGTGSLRTQGSGVPVAKFKTAPQKDLVKGSYVTVASMSLDAGKWMVLARTNVRMYGSVICRLYLGSNNDRTDLEYGGSGTDLALPFEAAYELTSPGTVSLRCYASGLDGENGVAKNARLTAIRVATLTTQSP